MHSFNAVLFLTFFYWFNVRFWCAIRLQQLDFRIRYSRTPSIEELVVDSRLIVWAFHSDCQAILFSTILPAEPTWEDMRKLGVGFWFTNLSDLRSKVYLEIYMCVCVCVRARASCSWGERRLPRD